MNRLLEDFELYVIILLTLLAKWLMSEEIITDEETEAQLKMRRKRTYGGMIAGIICGYYGPDFLINWSKIPNSFFDGVFTSDLIIPLTIILVISGEHIFRALITKLPSWIDMFVKKRISK